MKTQKKTKLDLKKFQISKIKNPLSIHGGEVGDDDDRRPRADGTLKGE